MRGPPSSEVTVAICLVPWPEFSQAPEDILLAHLCRFAVRSAACSTDAGLFLEAWHCALPLARSSSALRSSPKLRLPPDHPTALHRLFQQAAAIAFSVPPASTHATGPGILTGFPSPTPFGLGLGSDSPWADEPPPGNLGLTAGRFLTCLVATHIGISSRSRSTRPSGRASSLLRRSPTARPIP